MRERRRTTKVRDAFFCYVKSQDMTERHRQYYYVMFSQMLLVFSRKFTRAEIRTALKGLRKPGAQPFAAFTLSSPGPARSGGAPR